MTTKNLMISLATALTMFGSVQAQTKKPVVKAKAGAASATDVKASIQRGQVVYAQNCLSCHQADGGGVQNMNAPLVKTAYVLGNNQRLISVLLKGMQGVEIEGETYTNVMPQFTHLSNKQIADVLTYVRNSFGNKANAIKEAEVAEARKKVK
ncbi:cytochrome c [Mucilaginibacter sp. PAMB04168]|uniref:c-type cytochrome n=1 Tax=Mucilaginibacter sp. PAMB04168 TaxID=3138567 RepID=UPI0031F64F10